MRDRSKLQESGIFIIIACILLFLIYKKVERRVGLFTFKDVASSSFWTTPETHGGWLAQRIDKGLIETASNGPRIPPRVMIIHQATTKAIYWWNGMRRWWFVFLLALSANFLSLFHLLFRTKRKVMHYVAFRVFLAVGFIGTLGHLALAPLTENILLNLLSGMFYGIGLLSIVASLVNASNPNPRDRKRRVKYGPAFQEPSMNGAGTIHIATYEKRVLPEASRWAAKSGHWPVEIPLKKISSGITILGEKGSGKSRLMFAIHDELRSKFPNVPILIHDPKGEWYRTYFDKATDVVFGPNIEGSSTWDVWSDLKDHPEMLHGVINTAVYAHPSNGDTFWLDQAVRLLENAFSMPTIEAARDYLIAKREANIDDKMFLSIYGTAKLALHDIVKVVLTNQKAASVCPALTVDDYLNWRGRILLLNNPAFAAEQRGAFSLFLSAFLLRALSLPDVPAGQLRLVAFIDEALTFTLPPEIEKLIYTQCRSKGIVIIAGAQRLPESTLKESGEWSTAEYIFAMKVLNLQTQGQLAKRAGDISYEEKVKAKQQDQGGQERGGSESSHSQTHSAIPPETFGRLKNRECILFHDAGIAPCKTNLVERDQRDILLPNYTARAEVIEFMKKLD